MIKSQATPRFKLITKEDGCLWLLSDTRVYRWDPLDQTGHYGDVVGFVMEDNTLLELKGPWLALPHAFTIDTGIVLDLRKYYYEIE